MTEPTSTMVLLGGEQTAPNLLPARHFLPDSIYVLHTDFGRSKLMAERLALRLPAANIQLSEISAYDPKLAAATMLDLLRASPGALVNTTGGTKPMSIAALLAAREAACRPFYVRSQYGTTELDFYTFDVAGLPAIENTVVIEDAIEIDDYLVAYFGADYQFTGYGPGAGLAFEEAIHNALADNVDEIKVGWKHASGAVDVDFVVRCNNQIGIVEAKTGKKAETTEGIRQLAVAGGQRFFGTYTKRFLIVDRVWREKSNNRALTEALGLVLVELPGFASEGVLNEPERSRLVETIHKALGKPTRSKDKAQ